MKKYDIYWADFAFEDTNEVKSRPVVIIENGTVVDIAKVTKHKPRYKYDLVLLDLPAQFARSCYKDIYGRDIIEFDVTYFSQITDKEEREEELSLFPSVISKYYRRYAKGRETCSWVKVPSELGVCFSFTEDGAPLFLSTIPATIQYDEAVDTERERDLDEIRKILIQKIPHLQDGSLLFEPEEAVEMHLTVRRRVFAIDV